MQRAKNAKKVRFIMEKKDLVIIGSGPAGLSAAVYAQRAMLDQVVIEKEMFSGGQIVTTDLD